MGSAVFNPDLVTVVFAISGMLIECYLLKRKTTQIGSSLYSMKSNLEYDC